MSILKESITKFIIEKTVLHALREPFRTSIIDKIISDKAAKITLHNMCADYALQKFKILKQEN